VSYSKDKDKHFCRVKPTLLREQTITQNLGPPGWGLCRRMATTLFKNTSFEENCMKDYVQGQWFGNGARTGLKA
jgi:hypothetical protein